jgi:hypothetical protein
MNFVLLFLLPALAGVLTWLLTSREWNGRSRILASAGVILAALSLSYFWSGESMEKRLLGTWHETGDGPGDDFNFYDDVMLEADHTFTRANGGSYVKSGHTANQPTIDMNYNEAHRVETGKWSYDEKTETLLLTREDHAYPISYSVHRSLWGLKALQHYDPGSGDVVISTMKHR